MRPSAAEQRRDPAGGLGVERWRHDDLAAWIKGSLEEEAAAPSGQVWRAIERELSVPRPSGWLRLRHAYASLGSAVALAYALSFGALMMSQRGAGAELGCAAGCPWDRLSEDEIARQSRLVSVGVDAYPGWVFQVRLPRREHDALSRERYDRRYLLEWGSVTVAMDSGWDTKGPANIVTD